MKHNEIFYLQNIMDSILRIEQYLSGVSEKDFQENSLVQDGVIRQLEIIGEAVKHLPLICVHVIRTFPGRILPVHEIN